jgi:methionyl-tRNA synthetase
MGNKFYITTPIYYINDLPTIGHSYTTIAADVLARWHRLQGDNVFFLTGLDENSQKTVEAAKAQEIKDIQKYTDTMAEKWEKVWKTLNINYDGFIRTTEKRHQDLVKKFFMNIYKKKDIYKGYYKGLYCGGCEAYLTENDLVDGLCPYHKKKPEHINEENYFFRLSKYENKILKHLVKNPDFIQPTSRRNEVIGFVKKGLQDISISRQNSEWGIPLPIDEKHRFWCWFDALLNYISGTKEKYWPATIHLIGKDILRFHAVIWPAMLLSAGYELPETIFAHGFFTINGQKMSKSLGNIIDPNKLVEKYGADAVRYLLLSQFPFGRDGDIKEDLFLEKYNTDLANGIGNLFERVFSLINKFSKEDTNEVKAIDKKIESFFLKIESQYKQHIEAYDLFGALKDLPLFVRELDRYINDKEPWALYKKNSSDLNTILNSLFFGIKKLNVLIQPFMPNKANEIEFFIKKFSNLQSRKKIGRLNLFPRINKNIS